MNQLRSTIQRKPSPRGFTIIETLVAITVLMIAIAGPLVIATKSLNSAMISKNQMVASYLAQESLEMIKNRRDSNVSAHQDDIENWWLDGFGLPNPPGSSGTCYDSTHTCDIGGIDDDIISCPTTGCVISFSSSTGYNHAGSGTVSGFLRRFYFEDKAINNLKSEKLVHVFVNWYEGTVPYEVHVTSQLVAVGR